MRLYLGLALSVLTAVSSWPVSAAETGAANAAARIISGSIRSDGSIATGTGFSVSREDTGQYRISFSPGFKETPAIVGNQNNFGSMSEGTTDTVVFPSVDANSAVALTGDTSGNKQNRNFAFIARGL